MKFAQRAGRNRAAIVGDIAAGTSAASRIAWQIGESHPELIGDHR